MAHHHHHGSGAVLRWSTAVTLAFVAVELVAGLRAHSLALVSDAGHNFADALALVLAAAAAGWQYRPANSVKTFGYHRAGVLAAFVNALALVLIALGIFYESWRRMLSPEAVDARLVVLVAMLGMAVNLGIVWALHRGRSDMNVRAAYIHMLGDALSAASVAVGGLLIALTGQSRIDPAISALIGAMIVWSAWDILKESLNVLLEGLPRGIDLRAVTDSMLAVEGVIDVHDLHIWSLGSNAHALSCHALIDDVPPSASDAILKSINELLCRFEIRHTTVQFEHARCALSDSPCNMAAPAGHAHEHKA